MALSKNPNQFPPQTLGCKCYEIGRISASGETWKDYPRREDHTRSCFWGGGVVCREKCEAEGKSNHACSQFPHPHLPLIPTQTVAHPSTSLCLLSRWEAPSACILLRTQSFILQGFRHENHMSLLSQLASQGASWQSGRTQPTSMDGVFTTCQGHLQA